jgi:hypothetical protein
VAKAGPPFQKQQYTSHPNIRPICVVQSEFLVVVADDLPGNCPERNPWLINIPINIHSNSHLMKKMYGLYLLLFLF